ncbi:MAG: MBL fold metallo-hydrolase [Gemmatimonadaceae bacterium]
MLLKRFYDTNLAQASYLIGCAATGEAIIIDPNRDAERYIRAAAEEGMRVSHVTETHIHADFVSGSRELAQRAGAQLLLSGDGDGDWKYAFASAAGAKLLHDGDKFMVGNLRFDVLHTPGHTPEHLSFLVTDTPATDRPMGMITGDFVFVGDVGRPDLLERAAKQTGTMETAARTLFQSVQRFKQLPDYVQVWPGHGAGSACGKSLGAVPFSTVGYERMTNWALSIHDEDEFVRAVLAGQPEPPTYFAEMKRINKEGPGILGSITRPELLPLTRLEQLLESGAMVLDTRPAADYAAGYIPGTINIPLNKSFTTWAGWLVPYDRDLYLISGGEADGVDGAVCDAVRDLTMIGFDRVRGYFRAGVGGVWTPGSGESERASIPQVSAAQLATQLEHGSVNVIDVRSHSEWIAGHLPGANNIPLAHLGERLDEIPRDKPVVVQCQSGGRSAIAASLLRAWGLVDVMNLAGGFAGWQETGNTVERPAGED